MLNKPPLLGSPETKALVKKVANHGIEHRIAERYPRTFELWKDEAGTVIETLAECGIHTPNQYCSFKLRDNEKGDNSEQICSRIFKAKKFKEDKFTFFNLGRIHQALEHERTIRNDEIEKLRPSTPSENEIHRRKIEERDIGSRAPYRNEKSFLEERLKERDFVKSFAPRNERPENKEDEPPTKKLKTPTEMESACEELFDLAFKWQYHSEFLKNAQRAKLSIADTKKNLLLAATVQIRSHKTIKLYCKNLDILTKFLEKKEVPLEQWTGPESVFFIAEHLRLYDSTQTVAHFKKTTFKFFKNVLGLDWNLDHPIIANSSKVARKTPKKQAPAFEAFQIKELEKTAADDKNAEGLRIFCSALLIMVHASLRWSDTREVSNLKLKNGVISGTILTSKTSADPLDFCCPEKGFKNLTWSHPLFRFRENVKKTTGRYPRFLFPSTQKGWKFSPNEGPKRQIEQRMREYIFDIGVPSGTRSEQYTLHSPRNFYTNGAGQLGWNLEAQTILGRWKKNSIMPEHYSRSSGSLELQIRSDLANRVRKGWEPKGKNEIPMAPPASAPHASRLDTAPQ